MVRPNYILNRISFYFKIFSKFIIYGIMEYGLVFEEEGGYSKNTVKLFLYIASKCMSENVKIDFYKE